MTNEKNPNAQPTELYAVPLSGNKPVANVYYNFKKHIATGTVADIRL